MLWRERDNQLLNLALGDLLELLADQDVVPIENEPGEQVRHGLHEALTGF